VASEPTEVPTVAPEPDPTATTEPPPEPTAEPAAEEEPEVEEESADSAIVGEGPCNGTPAGGTVTTSFEFEGRARSYEQLVPSAYDGVTPLPVVLNWHGLGSNGPDQLGFSEYGTLAESEGFIVIAPTGVASPDDADGRNSWELEPDQDPGRDDIAFANQVLDMVIADLCVDASRVYTTGMSNGGYFSSVLACEMSDRIAAAAAVAALTHADDCDPERDVPIIGFHGTDDDVVPYDGGGISSLAPDIVVPLFELKILDEFAEFAVNAGCDAEPVVTEFSENVNQFDFGGCADGVTRTFYEIEQGGHTWPGSILSSLISESVGLGKTTTQINASQVSWDFFEQHTLPIE